jgi:hypothetical protein
MNSSAEPHRIQLTTAEIPNSVRVASDLSVADLVRRVEASAATRLEAARREIEDRVRAELADEVEALVRGCRAEVELLSESLLDSAIELGAVLAEAAVHQRIDVGLDLAPAVRACFERSGAERSACRVRVHPDALAGLSLNGIAERFECVADRDLEPGEVRLDTPVGVLVHDPLQALGQARDALLTQLTRSGSTPESTDRLEDAA